MKRLDPALIRPGRVDLHVALGHADESQIQTLFTNFYPEATKAQAADFAKKIVSSKLSMAHIQGHFLTNKNNPSAAIENVRDLLKHSKESL